MLVYVDGRRWISRLLVVYLAGMAELWRRLVLSGLVLWDIGRGLGWGHGARMDERRGVLGHAEFFAERRELRLKPLVLRGELHDAGLEDHIVHAAFLAGPFGGLVVAAPAVPVGVVFAGVGGEFALFARGDEVAVVVSGGGGGVADAVFAAMALSARFRAVRERGGPGEITTVAGLGRAAQAGHGVAVTVAVGGPDERSRSVVVAGVGVAVRAVGSAV